MIPKADVGITVQFFCMQLIGSGHSLRLMFILSHWDLLLIVHIVLLFTDKCLEGGAIYSNPKWKTFLYFLFNQFKCTHFIQLCVTVCCVLLLFTFTWCERLSSSHKHRAEERQVVVTLSAIKASQQVLQKTKDGPQLPESKATASMFYLHCIEWVRLVVPPMTSFHYCLFSDLWYQVLFETRGARYTTRHGIQTNI